MKVKKIFKILFILIILVTNISCDQISKSIVRKKIDYHEKISLVNNHVTLTKVENTGAFLSLGNNMPRLIYKILMIILPLIVLGYILYYLLFKNNLSWLLVIGLSIIIGGGFGNICDRMKYGSVTDFLHIDFVMFKTGIFNMADLSVMIGMLIVLYDLFIKKKQVHNSQKFMFNNEVY